VCEDGLFIPGFVVHHAHGEKMERVKVKLRVSLNNVSDCTTCFQKRSIPAVQGHECNKMETAYLKCFWATGHVKNFVCGAEICLRSVICGI
jgi:hypothetical protein